MVTDDILTGTRFRTDSKADSLDEKVYINDSSTEHVIGKLSDLDVALTLAAGHAEDPDLTIEESRRLRNKIDWHLVPLLMAVYTVQFIDKGSLASSSILGIIQENNLTTDDFNTLSSAFYIGYLVFQWPQNWALQRLPVGKWITFNIFLWCLFLGLHPVGRNFGGLCASEGCMTTGLALVLSMFYTRTEIGERIGWALQFNGVAIIISGFISFAAYHAPASSRPSQWQWMMISTTIMSFIVFILFLLYFPDNPTTARFLTEEEKLKVVKRVQANQNGIETKRWKKKQFIETLWDPKTWLFFFYAPISVLQSGIGVQYSLVIQSFGFSTLQTTLLNIPSGFSQVIGLMLGCYALRRFPNARSWIAVISYVPPMLAALMEIFVPLENKAAHLVGVYLVFFGGSVGFNMVFSWVTSVTSGHTKRMTTSAIFFVGYALGQILCTQFWKLQYRPRSVIPWAITFGSYIFDIAFVLAIHCLLASENGRRDALRAQAEATGEGLSNFSEFAYVETTDKNGVVIKGKVEKALLDMTDRENLSFRYVL